MTITKPRQFEAAGRNRRRSAPGFVMVAVLASLFVVMILAATVVQSLIVHHRESKSLEYELQALWTLESAVERAIDHLAETPGYQGETWTMPSGLLVDGQSAGADIVVEPLDEDGFSHRLVVTASFQPSAFRTITHRRELKVNVGGGDS